MLKMKKEGEGSRERESHRESGDPHSGRRGWMCVTGSRRARPLGALHRGQPGGGVAQGGTTLSGVTLAEEAPASRCSEAGHALSTSHLHWTGLPVFTNAKHSCTL